jgi:hypothetical protein
VAQRVRTTGIEYAIVGITISIVGNFMRAELSNVAWMMDHSLISTPSIPNVSFFFAFLDFAMHRIIYLQ